MEYAQLNADGTYSHQITTHGNVEWDTNHFCPAAALSPQEAVLFRVVPLQETEPPAYNPETHSCMRDGAVYSNGQWQYHWKVEALTPEQRAIALASAKADKNQEINEARLMANRTSFIHQGKAIACDELSRGDIDAIASHINFFGVFPAGFPNGWKAIDNSYVPLADVDAFKAMHSSMVNQGNVNFAHAQELKAQLAAATTISQVQTIMW